MESKIERERESEREREQEDKWKVREREREKERERGKTEKKGQRVDINGCKGDGNGLNQEELVVPLIVF